MSEMADASQRLDELLSVSDSEAEAIYIKTVAEEWLRSTREGQSFARYYDNESNRKKLAAVFDLLSEELSLETLSGAFRKLRDSGALRTEQEIREAAEQAEQQRDEANRAKWAADCEAWIETHSTNEIKARSERDRAFRSYLQAANRLPQLAVEYSKENLSRQREAEKVQRQRDRQYADIPVELWRFAENYKRLPAAEALKRMKTEPPFKAVVEACASAGIL